MSIVKLKLLIALLLLTSFSYCQKDYSNASHPTTKNKIIQLSCFILRPIKHNMELDDTETQQLNIQKNKNIFNYVKDRIQKNNIKIDKQSACIMNFDIQQKISIGQSCFELMKKDSIDLSYLYFTTLSQTPNGLTTKIFLEKHFELNINNFGNAIIFQYRFNAASMAEPARMYIILKPPDIENEIDDYVGFVLRADYIDWSINISDSIVPTYVTLHRQNRELHIPLFFDKNQFIPIGYFLLDF